MSEISSPKSRRVRGSVSVPWELPLVESLEPRLLLSQGFSFNISNIATGASPFSVAAGGRSSSQYRKTGKASQGIAPERPRKAAKIGC